MAKRWKPNIDEKYFAVTNDATVDKYTWRDDWCDRALYAAGNCFITKAAAKSAAKKFKNLLLSLHEPTEYCNQLPKLTTEVFNRPDCPKWARYATVDKDGKARFHSKSPFVPTILDSEWEWRSEGNERCIGGEFDASDWKDSMIERPVVLPDWLKVDAVGWCERYGYFKVTDIAIEGVYVRRVDDNSKGYLSFHTACNEAVHAHQRPYNESEMKALVGRHITMQDGSVCLCTAYSKPYKSVIFDNMHWEAQELMNRGYTIDGKPCFVLERLNEKGEWVE